MSTLSYRGYVATVEFDSEDMILTGRIAGINDVVGFHAETPAELLAAFHEAVDDYLETCAAGQTAGYPVAAEGDRFLTRTMRCSVNRFAQSETRTGKSISEKSS